jgi:hypothetical protein
MTPTHPSEFRPRNARDLVTGFILGIAIALSLSTLMLVAQMEKVSGVPMPLGIAFAAHLFGAATLGERGLLPVGLALHVGYVATATALATIVFRRRGLLAATVTALALWVLAGLTITPYVGWGLFAAGASGRAFLGLLAVHVVYAVFLWVAFWLAFHHIPRTRPADDAYPDSTAAATRIGLGNVTARRTQ